MPALKNINAEPKLTNYLVKNKLIKLRVVDVGARGGFADYWSFYNGCIELIGFEPDKKEVSPGIYPYALGDGTEKVFYHVKYPASSSFYPPNTDFCNRLQNRDFLTIVDTQEIETVTLDELNLKPDFIKLDTEGSELDILKHGIETLKTTLGISVEVEFQELFKGQPLFEDVHKFIKEQGFTLYDLSLGRLERFTGKEGMSNGEHGQIIQGQALYFRDIKDLKIASLMELFNLKDCAYEILPDELKHYLL